MSKFLHFYAIANRVSVEEISLYIRALEANVPV